MQFIDHDNAYRASFGVSIELAQYIPLKMVDHALGQQKLGSAIIICRDDNLKAMVYHWCANKPRSR